MAHELTAFGDSRQSTGAIDPGIRREYLVAALADAGGTESVDDLAAAVRARIRNGQTGTSAGKESTLRISLYHSDLPKLASEGVVDFDPTLATATLRDRPEDVEPAP